MASSRKSRKPNKFAATLSERIERALEGILARVVVSGGGAVALAYSGGLDSSVLLRLLADHCHRTGRTLHAFHVHHGLSPNADAWLDHCAKQASAAGVRFDSARVSLADSSGQGIEQAARVARYQALGELCRRHGVRLLLTAHHQDDQAETVLLQLMRGAGLRGLSGMAEVHEASELIGPGLLLGRPLLACSRDELAQLALALDIPHVIDESNDDVRYRRNALRHRVMPAIGAHFPGFAATVSRSAAHWQAAQALLDDLAEIDEARCAEGDALRIDCLSELSVERIDNLLRYWLSRQAPLPPSAAQLAQLRRQALSARDDAHPSVEFGGLCVQRHGGLLVAMAHAHSRRLPPRHPQQIVWNGEPEIAVPDWQGSLCFEPGAGQGLCPVELRAGPILLCPRSGGERLQPEQQRPSRTLKNLFQESAVPAQQRPWLPLVYLGDRLVHAAGLGTDARAAQVAGGVRLTWRSEGLA